MYPVCTCNSSLLLQSWVIQHRLSWTFIFFFVLPSWMKNLHIYVFFCFFFFSCIDNLLLGCFDMRSFSVDIARHGLEPSWNAAVFSRVCFWWCYSSISLISFASYHVLLKETWRQSLTLVCFLSHFFPIQMLSQHRSLFQLAAPRSA